MGIWPPVFKRSNITSLINKLAYHVVVLCCYELYTHYATVLVHLQLAFSATTSVKEEYGGNELLGRGLHSLSDLWIVFLYEISHNCTVDSLIGFCIERPGQQGTECRKHWWSCTLLHWSCGPRPFKPCSVQQPISCLCQERQLWKSSGGCLRNHQIKAWVGQGELTCDFSSH